MHNRLFAAAASSALALAAGTVSAQVPPGPLDLIVDLRDGNTSFINNGTETFNLVGYQVVSASSSLNSDGWNSLADQGVPGFVAVTGVDDPNAIVLETTLNPSAPLVVAPDISFNLGNLFDHVDGEQDLVFQYNNNSDRDPDTGGFILFQGDVIYVIPEPATLGLLSLGGLALLRRRRR